MPVACIQRAAHFDVAIKTVNPNRAFAALVGASLRAVGASLQVSAINRQHSATPKRRILYPVFRNRLACRARAVENNLGEFIHSRIFVFTVAGSVARERALGRAAECETCGSAAGSIGLLSNRRRLPARPARSEKLRERS